MRSSFFRSKSKREMKLGPPLLEKKGTQTCDDTPHYAKVPSFEKYVAHYFYDVHVYMFALTFLHIMY